MQCQKTFLPSELKNSQKIFKMRNYSKIIVGYKKLFVGDRKYKDELAKMIGHADRKKLTRIIGQIKQQNSQFKKYLHKKRIQVLKAEDVINFQLQMERSKRKSILKNKQQHAEDQSIEYEIVRLGFMMIYERLLTQNSNIRINEYNYLREEIIRQTDMINRYQLGPMHIQHQNRAIDVMAQLNSLETKHGKFDLINSKLRQETTVLQGISQHLKDQTLK